MLTALRQTRRIQHSSPRAHGCGARLVGLVTRGKNQHTPRTDIVRPAQSVRVDRSITLTTLRANELAPCVVAGMRHSAPRHLKVETRRRGEQQGLSGLPTRTRGHQCCTEYGVQMASVIWICAVECCRSVIIGAYINGDRAPFEPRDSTRLIADSTTLTRQHSTRATRGYCIILPACPLFALHEGTDSVVGPVCRASSAPDWMFAPPRMEGRWE